MSNMYSAGGRTSVKGLRDGELCTSPAVGARAMTLRPADEKSCSSHVSHALLGLGFGFGLVLVLGLGLGLRLVLGGVSTTETLQSLPSKNKHQPLCVPAATPVMGSWGEVTLGRSVVSDVSCRPCTAQDRTSMKGLRDGELCTFQPLVRGQ